MASNAVFGVAFKFSMNSLWTAINSFQLITYMNLMPINYPAHVLVFYKGVQSIVNFSIPELWINFSQDGIKLKKASEDFDNPEDGPLTSDLEQAGFESKVWVNNFGFNMVVVGGLTVLIILRYLMRLLFKKMIAKYHPESPKIKIESKYDLRHL